VQRSKILGVLPDTRLYSAVGAPTCFYICPLKDGRFFNVYFSPLKDANLSFLPPSTTAYYVLSSTFREATGGILPPQQRRICEKINIVINFSRLISRNLPEKCIFLPTILSLVLSNQFLEHFYNNFLTMWNFFRPSADHRDQSKCGRIWG
jgi:hypothetical protein